MDHGICGLAWDGYYMWILGTCFDGPHLWKYDLGTHSIVRAYPMPSDFYISGGANIDLAVQDGDFWFTRWDRLTKFTLHENP